MKKIIQIISIFGITLSISVICNSCKMSKKDSSELASLVECECDDMACWRTKSDEKSWEALKCAGEAAALATGVAIKNKIKAIVESGKEVSKALEYGKKVAGNAGDLSRSITDLSSLTDPTFWLSMTTSISKDFELKRQNIECGKNFAEVAAGAFLLVAGAIRTIKDMFATKVGDDEESVAKLTDVTLTSVKASSAGISHNRSFIATISLGFATCKSCFAAIKRLESNDPKIKFLKSIMTPIETFLENALTAFVLVDCGYKITSSSIYLIANTQCLASDLASVYDSYKALEKQDDNTLRNEVIDCNEEAEKTCSTVIAYHYGAALQKRHPYIDIWTSFKDPIGYLFSNQPEYCYEACFDKNKAKKLCYEVNLGDKLINPEVCRKKCAEQTGECLFNCSSYCCLTKGDCQKEVKRIYNKNH